MVVFCILLISLGFIYIVFFRDNQAFQPSGLLEIHYIDVGQGDSTLIISPEGRSMLVDAGDPDHGDDVVKYLKKRNIKKIDYLMASHPDSDHIGGMRHILQNFRIDNVIAPLLQNETGSFYSFVSELKKNGLSIHPAVRGDAIPLSPTIRCDIIHPESRIYENSNDYSVSFVLTHQKHRFLFLGDVGKEIEAELGRKKMIPSDITGWKLSHHGSNSSTDESMLRLIKPSFVIISSGFQNDYGHPAPSVLKALERNDIIVYRTDVQGDIVIYSDGKELRTNQKEPSGYQSYNKNIPRK